MPFSNTVAASYGHLSMYAMDMYRVRTTLLPDPAPGLLSSGFEVLAYITGGDTPFIRGMRMPIPVDLAVTVYYGFVAMHRASGECVAVIRGTDGFVEWIEDAEFVPVFYQPELALEDSLRTIKVEQGFWTLYQSLELIGPDGGALGKLAPAIARAVPAGQAPVTVVGHSLGAALATYLTLDLARGPLAKRVQGCFFASPHAGNTGFAALFDAAVPNYRLFNYILDIVPRVPLGPDYTALPRRTVLQPATAEANIRMEVGCNHHVVCYCAMLDYEGTRAAITPMPAGEEGSIPCILGPETGAATLAKRLVADLAGVVPV